MKTKQILGRELRWIGLVIATTFTVGSVHSGWAVSPPPDGGYPGANTAEGEDALFSLTMGTANTAIGYQALHDNTSGLANTATGSNALTFNITGNFNTAIGQGALEFNISGDKNTASGATALFLNTTGAKNTANGSAALKANTTGRSNTAIGSEAMLQNTTGDDNTALGRSALRNNTTGSSNIALGAGAGTALIIENNNIDIGHSGAAGDSGTIRIGTAPLQANTYIAGISGTTVPNGIQVVIDQTGHLGTVTSSERYKESVQPMGEKSETILSLEPVTFRYKKDFDPAATPQFGLVAEQVEKVNPALVVRDRQGKPYSVRYEAINAMLLNEFLKAHQRIENLEATSERQQKEIEKLEAALAAQ